MRLSSLAGYGLLLAACSTLAACGDDDDSGGPTGGSSSDAGSAGKSTAGSKNQGGSDAKAGSGGTTGGGDEGGAPDVGGTGGSAGSGGSGGSDTAGTAGTGGTAPTPECTKDADCADDLNPCTDEKCTDGKCGHPANTATCDDKNGCTSNDKCVDGACKGTNTTDACDDLSSCTSDDKCKDGACTGTNDAVMCPACAGPDNLVKNCDFSMGTDNWAQSFDDGAVGTQTVVNGRLVVDITAGGANGWSIQPRQEMLSIKKGMKYKFSFLAGASADRFADISVRRNYGDYAIYSDSYHVALQKQMKPYSYTFTATQPDDANMKIEIQLGTAAANPAANSVYFDDFVLEPIKCTDAASCTDDNVCTDDVCSAEGICSHTNNTADCATDDKLCTKDVCAAGVCTHPNADDGTACEADADDCTADKCATGVCGHVRDQVLCPNCTLDTQCDDTNPCTDDKCNNTLCEHTNNTAVCDDNNACTTGDVCAAGACTPGAANTDACDDKDICTIQTMCAASACGGGLNFCNDCTVAGNLINNCNFATDATGWGDPFVGGQGTQAVTDGMWAVTTTDPADANYKVQPRQEGLTLVKDKTYIVAFKAKASVARSFQLSITRNGAPYTSYSGVKQIALTTELQEYTFEFTMPEDPVVGQEPKLEMDLGGAANNPTVPNTVYIDDVVIRATP